MKQLAFIGLLGIISLGYTFKGGGNKHIPAAQTRPVADTALNGEWFLQPVLPSDTATGKIPSLTFNTEQRSFSGNDGCNTISGTFRINGSFFRFNKNITSTETTCPGYNEKEFMDALLMVNHYTIQDSVLTFMYNQTVLSRWTRSGPAGKSHDI